MNLEYYSTNHKRSTNESPVLVQWNSFYITWGLVYTYAIDISTLIHEVGHLFSQTLFIVNRLQTTCQMGLSR